ncbi:transglycosylase SLT domain-containing protein [Streptomyces sp. NPDC004647]|uniref:transglycosylase SLT domain-containing protein n=1 Tax=Streptomyces sp. NPDC004647 TaxID=3154671 RepID=UPI0033BC4761
MPVPTFSRYARITKTHKLSAAGITAASVAALAFAVVPGSAEAEQGTQSSQALSAKPVAWHADSVGKIQKDSLTEQSVQAAKKAEAEKKKAAEEMAKKKAAFAAKAKADAKAKAEADAKAKAEKERQAKEAANRSKARQAAPKAQYPNNLDGWIREAMSIMKKEGIPGSYEGIHRNIIRESGGDPNIANNWDINAQNGTPSIGLLQVIQPTFDAYHVEGTANDLRDPVANIVAACNYAADRYGSMDNVNSAY